MEAIEAAGLTAEVVVEDYGADPQGDDAQFPAGTLLGVSPELGSVVAEGATVTVAVAGVPTAG